MKFKDEQIRTGQNIHDKSKDKIKEFTEITEEERKEKLMEMFKGLPRLHLKIVKETLTEMRDQKRIKNPVIKKMLGKFFSNFTAEQYDIYINAAEEILNG